jgi:hypothetical protein
MYCTRTVISSRKHNPVPVYNSTGDIHTCWLTYSLEFILGFGYYFDSEIEDTGEGLKLLIRRAGRYRMQWIAKGLMYRYLILSGLKSRFDSFHSLTGADAHNLFL